MKELKLIIIIALTALAVQSCKKEQNLYKDPYADAKSPLGILMDFNIAPAPAFGVAGTPVFFAATGLVPYKDSIVFMFNGEKADIISMNATGINVKVPAAASTGITSVSVGNQLVIGPQFTVTGLIKLDPSFRATNGANGSVNQVYPLADGRDLVVGSFNNYDNKGIVSALNRIVRTSSDGEFDRSFRTGRGANGSLGSVMEAGNKFIIAGGFSGYGQRTENISNITSLFNNGSIDTVGIKTYRRPSQTDTTMYFPRFNGGTDSYIDHLYSQRGKILATGGYIRYYVKRRYEDPNSTYTRDTVKLDSTEIRQIVRFNLDGSLDSTFRFNIPTRKGLPGANGPINSFMHTDVDHLEKLLVFGSFTTFDLIAAGRIVRLNVDGSIDNSFLSGTGADNSIRSLTYNSITKKYLITGIFQNYNGKHTPGIALLNEDGSLDESFVAKTFEGGYAALGRQLKDGLIVVSGDFKKYNNVTRNGFMVLTPTGEFAPGYNATGVFSGGLVDIVETKSADNKRALLLIGWIYRFDNQPVSNITRVTIE